MLKQEIAEKKVWLEIRSAINRKYAYNNDWEDAIKLLERRFNRLYLKPLEELDNRKGYGEDIMIVTMQCALIEVLAAFRVGGIYKYKRTKNYHYNHTRSLFVKFLRNSPVFQYFFWTSINGRKIFKPYNAEKFYIYIRCGLSHEMRPKGNWRIKSSRRASSQLLLEQSGDFIYVNRSVLLDKIRQILWLYYNELRDHRKKSYLLRKNLARKMDDWFGIGANRKYDWWNI
jgi:hypothetical protein